MVSKPFMNVEVLIGDITLVPCKFALIYKCKHQEGINIGSEGCDDVTPSRSCILNLGPLHTQAKSCDHEIVRALKKVFEGRPKTPPKSCSVIMDPQV